MRPEVAPETGVRAVLAAAAHALAAAGIDSAPADAEWLLAGVLGVRRPAIHLLADGDLPPVVAEEYAAAVRRRAAREPLQRILGWEEFHGLRFHLTEAVLVPRPETEVLVDWALALLPRPVTGRRRTVIDLGTGSGCIAGALASRRHDVRVLALDSSLAAIDVARANVAALGLGARVWVVAGDLLDSVRAGSVEMIVSNPPYLPTALLCSLAPEVTHHEPRPALDGGVDGLEVIRRLVAGGRRALNPGGAMVLETAGGGQARAVAALLNEAGFRDVVVHNDLIGTTRFAAGRA